jgi:hypothetical protein
MADRDWNLPTLLPGQHSPANHKAERAYEMADQQSVAPWFQAAADLFERYQGQTVVELAFGHLAIDAAELQAGTPGGPFWNRHAQRVYWLAGTPQGGGSPLPQPATNPNVTLVEGDPLEFLRNMTEPIDLLYLDGWPLGTPAYQERHLAAYEAARPRFHDHTLVLIGDTARDHGGKAALVKMAYVAEAVTVDGQKVRVLVQGAELSAEQVKLALQGMKLAKGGTVVATASKVGITLCGAASGGGTPKEAPGEEQPLQQQQSQQQQAKAPGGDLTARQQAMDAFRSNRTFSNWFHKVYKQKMGLSGGGVNNPDMSAEDILDAYQEWMTSGKPGARGE